MHENRMDKPHRIVVDLRYGKKPWRSTTNLNKTAKKNLLPENNSGEEG
jgi:hypothetical protein